MNNLTDQQILHEMARRAKQKRLNLNMTQAELARRSGLHVQTIKKFESGESPTLVTFIQLLRAFGDLNFLDTFMPDPGISPIELLKLKGKKRKRASGKASTKPTSPEW